MVSIDSALNHAMFHLATKANEKQFAQGLEDWVNAEIGQAALFYDAIAGTGDEAILYVFDVINNSTVVGYIGINASESQRRTLAFLIPTKGPSILALISDSFRELSIKNPSATEIIPVIYSYPKLGARAVDEDKSITIDIFTKEEVAMATPLQDDVQGSVCWSYWDEFPQAGNDITEWENEDNFITGNVKQIQSNSTHKTLGLMITPFTFTLTGSTKDQVNAIRTLAQTRPPLTSSTTLPVTLIGQNNSIYCACASLAMIYNYIYETALDQNEISVAMQTTPAGSTLNGQINSFNKYFSTDFEINLDKSHTITGLRKSIESFLPAKSGIRGHARVVSGYREDVFADPLSGRIGLRTELLLISDPEPIGTGSLRWEAVDAPSLKDFIFLQRKTT